MCIHEDVLLNVMKSTEAAVGPVRENTERDALR